ncbi:T9SS type A sorting domain-containing protein [Lewinella sp. LCG006]|uniref:fibronectin type III domain-containing protein n=1 Tax=Lewinella sp. LCG006 TaxID=3231911 RepID=UPI00345F39EF
MIKQYLLLTLLCVFSLLLRAQVNCSATASSGSGYPAFFAAGFDIENPDCEHTTFGPHITQVFDTELERNVFVFHSHIVEDNDRCQVFDRVRMEVKGGPNTSEALQHSLGDTSYYRWKFRVDEDFVGASSFCHIFQNKIFGGADSGFPVITLTLRAAKLEARHSGGDTGDDLGVLAEADLDRFRGKWVEGYLRQVHREDGAIYLTIKDMNTGLTLLSYENNNIDLWRDGAEYSRPKWGMYRLKGSSLQDEEIRFADFCVSEEGEDQCPEEAVLVPDMVAPTAPANLVASNVTISSVDLNWSAATDEYGVTAYDVLQDGIVVQTVTGLATTVNDLLPSTTYTFAIQARDEAGNISDPSNDATITTDSATALPDAASNPSPADGATNVSNVANLSWMSGGNTDDFEVYFGTSENPPLVSTQNTTTYLPDLGANTTYFWKLIARNENGATEGPRWSFTTGELNDDLPWEVYRADARPEIETNFFALNAAPAEPPVDEIIDDPNGADNRYFGFRSNTSENFRWRYALESTDTAYTIVARFKAVSPDVNGICYFDIRIGGWRQKVRINQTTIKLEKSSPVAEEEVPFNWNDELHLMRMIVNGNLTTIYVDENPVPLVSALSNEESTSSFFEWGKSGGEDYGAYVDWLAVDKTGVYAPGEGTPLPEDLFLSSDATLATLMVNGEQVTDFAPYQLDYTVDLTSTEVPILNYTTTSALATTMEMSPATVPNTQATVTVTAQDGWTVKTYTINYTGVTAVESPTRDLQVQVFPNPVREQLQIILSEVETATGTIFNLNGQVMKDDLLLRNGTLVDVSTWPKGVYILKVFTSENASSEIKFVLE